MPTHREQLNATGNRAAIRKQVIMRFLDEEPGTGKGDFCSKYIYEVDTLNDGRKVLLKRPARLNKGMDFTVHVENGGFGKKGTVDRPSHKDILHDLASKKSSNPVEYEKVQVLIRRIYDCENVEPQEYQSIKFNVGHPIEAILKSVQWLFIEQDVTYWNWSGRNMLFSKLREEGLC